MDLRPDDHVRGPEDAPLIVVYADFSCPYCALAHARLAARPHRRVFRHLALKAKHPRAVALARAAEAAARQGAFWPFHDSLYADQGRLEDPHLWERVRALGLDLDRFEADRRGPEAAARVERDTQEAVLAGAMTTPAFFTQGRPDERLYHEVVRND
jgi:protein-disulfide isomerase